MDYLRKEEFVPLAPEDEDTTVSVKHVNCENGEDHKARLRITKKSNGDILAYCHNCQRRGFYSGSGRNVFTHREKLIQKKVEAKDFDIKYNIVELPEDTSYELPIQASAWLYKARLTDDEIFRYGFGWSRTLDRVILPIYNENGDLVFWQGRDLSGNNPFKYINEKGPKPALFYSGSRSGKYVILTEDILSSIRCGRFLPSISALGTSLKKEHVVEIASNFDNVIIFFDDDNNTVRHQQLMVQRELATVIKGKCLIIHSGGTDPKEFSDDKLQEILLKALEEIKNDR